MAPHFPMKLLPLQSQGFKGQNWEDFSTRLEKIVSYAHMHLQPLLSTYIKTKWHNITLNGVSSLSSCDIIVSQLEEDDKPSCLLLIF
jgi:hypothetical protein